MYFGFRFGFRLLLVLDVLIGLQAGGFPRAVQDGGHHRHQDFWIPTEEMGGVDASSNDVVRRIIDPNRRVPKERSVGKTGFDGDFLNNAQISAKANVRMHRPSFPVEVAVQRAFDADDPR